MNHCAFTPFDALESEAIHTVREVAAECVNPVLLFFGEGRYCFIVFS